jgi:hypothetical protein
MAAQEAFPWIKRVRKQGVRPRARINSVCASRQVVGCEGRDGRMARPPGYCSWLSRLVEAPPTGMLRLSKGSCLYLLTILSTFLESCFGSVVGDTIATDLTDFTSGAAWYVPLELIHFCSRIVLQLLKKDVTMSVSEVSREQSAFANGTGVASRNDFH